MNQPAPVIKPAATVILARDTEHGLEVFMMRRTQKAAFAADAYVFPGGALDAEDHDPFWNQPEYGLDSAEANRILKVDGGGLGYWIAAIRECFEESGLLLARDSGGRMLDLDTPALAAEYDGLRQRLNGGDLKFIDLCQQRQLHPALDHLAYLSRWVTPPDAPRRFDTRFFVAVGPTAQTASHDNQETVDHLWISPHEALIGQGQGKMMMVYPTIATLQMLALFPNTDALMAYVRANGGAERTSDISYFVPHPLSCRIRRLTANNAGVMTGPGTNTYLVGGNDDITVIDPGPDIDFHVDNIVTRAGGTIRRILVTHTHPDHSPAAARLKARTGAEVLGMAAPAGGYQDRTFQPDRLLRHGERIPVGDATLRVIHTPGHASNHLCYLLEEEGALFTGDHIMQGSTVVISPPDGDMGDYLASLNLLLQEDLRRILPAHGLVIEDPAAAIRGLITHRLQREAKVLGALEAGGATLDQLLPRVYDDVPAVLHGQARQSLLAHLQKLAAEGRARESTAAEWVLT
ncbi:hypothetical protein B9N43_06090 [Denitratisoma sp. DHT3]|uniref:MBL fold metallo-hydrolase n=1 Tax=Denitratisoma sp. DHT3 TaxID=1981880 RepID=UPI001198AE1A|nr:MBL fold metallo-hydrolase [Denitratisoma sp. DHT3]QDX80851.1 hypothetical protein B9N43_06090 [Denitratisoma sp. DHT3]